MIKRKSFQDKGKTYYKGPKGGMACGAMSLECSRNSEEAIVPKCRGQGEGGSYKTREVGRMAPAGYGRPRQEFTIQN